jgi:hypothetical protein
LISGVRPVPEDNDNELDVIWEVGDDEILQDNKCIYYNTNENIQRLSKVHAAFYMLQDENKDEDNPLLVKADVKVNKTIEM